MDSRRLFLAALLSLVVLLVWQKIFPPPTPVRPAPDPIGAMDTVESTATEPGAAEIVPEDRSTRSEGQEAVESGARELASRPTVVAEREETTTVDTGRVEATFTNRGGQLVSYRLLDRPDELGESVELVRRRSGQPYPFGLWEREASSPLNDALFVLTREQVDGDERLVFDYSGPLGAVRKEFEFTPGRPGFRFRVLNSDGTVRSVVLGPGMRNPSLDQLDSRLERRSATWSRGDEVDSLVADKLSAPELISGSGVRWVAVEDRYFISALIPVSPVRDIRVVPVQNLVDEDGELLGWEPVPRGAEADDLSTSLLVAIEPAGEDLRGRAYFGEKQYDALRAERVGLEKTVRFGRFMGIFARPLLIGLRWIHDNVVANYGWSIVLLTIALRVVLFPLTHKSYVSMQKLQKLNPRMEAVRARYRPKLKDKQGRPNLEQQRKMNEEIQAIFREEGVNPAGGCLPVLMQMPVFFGFFRLLSEAVELWGAPWIGWVNNLAAPDPIYVLPLVMGAAQFAQQKMMPPPPQAAQRILMNTMPVWFTILAFGFPSGLVLYWLTNNILAIIQQGGYNRLKKAGYFGGEEPAKKKE